MKTGALVIVLCSFGLAACSGGSGLSVASILGGSSNAGAAPVAPAAAPAPISDPTSRAFHVGAATARAVKCGYNFDPQKLKANYIAAEGKLGTSPADMAKVEKVYAVAYNGVAKAAAEEPGYCSDRKTEEIKADLTRLLAGDFNPPPRKVAKEEEDGGLFSDWGSSDSKGLDMKPSTANGF